MLTMEKSRYSGALIAAVGNLKAERPELASAIDNALVGGRNKKGPTRRFEAVVRLARQGVWRPIETLLAHPYYRQEEAQTAEDELVNTRATFYELARQDLLFLETVGDGEKSLPVQIWLDKAGTLEELLAAFNGITFLAARCRLQEELSNLMKSGHYIPFVAAKIGSLYQEFVAVENMEDLARVQSQVKSIQGEIYAFQQTFSSFGG